MLLHTHAVHACVVLSLVSFDGSGFTCMCPGCGPKNRHFLVPALRSISRETDFVHVLFGTLLFVDNTIDRNDFSRLFGTMQLIILVVDFDT